MDFGGFNDFSRHRPRSDGCQSRRNGGMACEYGRVSGVTHNNMDYNMIKSRVEHGKYIRSDHDCCSGVNSTRRQENYKSKFRRRLMSTDIIFLTLAFCLCFCEVLASIKGTQPRLNGKPKVKMSAVVGDHIVLECPVIADPPPLTKWSFNGQSIIGVKPRFKVGFDLRIRDVRITDTGRYRCTARNAFGVVDHEINLTVRDPIERTTPSKPRFTMAGKMRRQTIAKPVNRSLRLRCSASGYPAPEIEWYKDGNLTHPQGSGRRQIWSFKIRKLQPSDSGRYRCRVWNSEGEINYTYDVQVVEQLRERPVLVEPHPMNTTVQVGGTTVIQCRVQSRVEPTVKWIKRLDDKAVTPFGSDLPQNVITIDDRHYMILPTQEMLRLENDHYLNKLVIRGATESHAGMYICLAANTMGYNFKYAYLNVVAGPLNSSLRSTSSPRTKLLPGSRTGQKGSLSLPAIIGVPAGIGLVMVVFLAWICQRRREQSLKSANTNVVVSGSDRLSALGSSETKSSTRSSPVPHDFDHLAEENIKDGAPQDVTGERGRKIEENYYSINPRPPPTAGTPLLTVNEPVDSEFDVPETEDDTYYMPAPPCSEVTSSYRSGGTEKRLQWNLGPPPPPPPSQKSASSLSYSDNRPPYSHHYHYMHPPGGSRRHHHYHGHHSRSGGHHHGY